MSINEIINYFASINMEDFFLNMLVFGVMGALIYRTLKINELENQKRVKKQAFTDQLTGSGNRHAFLSMMDKLLKKNKKFAICFMDLDGFKQINDTMGHDAGDALLISLANTFKEKLPKNAIAYRLRWR